MRIRLDITLDVERKDKQTREPEHYEVGLHANTEKAQEHTGPSMGFQIPDQQDRQADK